MNDPAFAPIAGYMGLILPLAGVLVGTACSAIFAGLETGLYVLNKVRLSLRASDGMPAAVRIENALNRSGSMLASLLLVNNASNYMVTASVVMMLNKFAVSDAEFYCTAIVAPFLFIFGEMAPKNFFRQTAEISVYRFSALLAWTMRLLTWTGLAPVLDMLSRALMKIFAARDGVDTSDVLIPEAVRAYLAEGHAHGALSAGQHSMAHRVMQLRGTTLADVMTPRRLVVSVPIDCPREQLVAVLGDHNFSRLPVWQGQSARVVGVVNLNRLLFDADPTATPAKYMTEPIWLDKNMSVSRSLLELQKSRHTMGFVCDRRRRFVGVVTLKDIVEEIVGELQAW